MLIKRQTKKILYILQLIVALGILSACNDRANPFNAIGLGVDDTGGNRSGNNEFSQNSYESIEQPYYGRVLLASPVILEKDPSRLSPTMNLSRYLSDPVYITDNPVLKESCAGDLDNFGEVENCWEVTENAGSPSITPFMERWAFEVTTSEFDQVQTFYHVGNVINYYLDALKDLYYFQAQPAVDPSLNYNTSIPLDLYNKNAHFFNGETLRAYARCDVKDNAFFDPPTFSLCLGYLSEYPQVKIAHDPSVIQHEMGHALTVVMNNMRTIAHTTDFPFRSDIKYFFYDEAGSINEGVSDFYAHIFDQRDAVFEYVFGTFENMDSYFRPIIEDHPQHAPGISTNVEDRLSYPHFINYVPDNPNSVLEDVHQGGMIASHFLTALKRSLMESCLWTHEEAAKKIFNILTETYAYLGDLSSTGNDFYPRGTVNLSSDLDPFGVPSSLLWYSRVRPINYRSWSQTFARFFVQTIANPLFKNCNGTYYSKDVFEQILDSYGLLLFENYNDDGNHHTFGHTGNNHKINLENRLKSIMATKDLIGLDVREDKSSVYIFDKRRDMLDAVESLLDIGLTSEISTKIDSELIHNNGNGQISPGEVVGIAFNLYNKSNTEMGGVQILANDWDHVKIQGGEAKPCPNFDDQWPSESEGAANVSSENSANPQSGDCHFITKTNGNPLASIGGDHPDAEINETIHPVCFVQITDENATYWASQEEYRQQVGLEKKDCLHEDQSSSCFINSIKGGDSAYFSRIEPNKSWAETIVNVETGEPEFGIHNLLFFEVNRETPPGTTFDCRFRVRFTNCKDCWANSAENNGDDYLDYEFSGDKPYKIIHYQFTVVN